MDVTKSSAGEAVGLQPCIIMVRSIALNINYTPMHQTHVIASETKVLRSTAGRGPVYLLPLNWASLLNVSKSSAGEAVGLQPCSLMDRSIAHDICYTPMYQTIVVAAETKVLRSTAGRVQDVRFP